MFFVCNLSPSLNPPRQNPIVHPEKVDSESQIIPTSDPILGMFGTGQEIKSSG
jgi:hypothetical protein